MLEFQGNVIVVSGFSAADQVAIALRFTPMSTGVEQTLAQPVAESTSDASGPVLEFAPVDLEALDTFSVDIFLLVNGVETEFFLVGLDQVVDSTSLSGALHICPALITKNGIMTVSSTPLPSAVRCPALFASGPAPEAPPAPVPARVDVLMTSTCSIMCFEHLPLT